MRCAGCGVLLLLLLSLSALSAEANKERVSDIAGRKWLRGRSAMAARAHGDTREDQGLEDNVAKNTGASQEADHASSEAVHDKRKGSATHPMFQQGAGDRRSSHDDSATVAADMLRVDYSVYKDAHSRGPINNDAPLDDLAEKNP
uniref:Uncharacterized protein n=1 Tax=Avena sativa TaxID=4498 RepID=A0ACD5YE83_AVESA